MRHAIAFCCFTAIASQGPRYPPTDGSGRVSIEAAIQDANVVGTNFLPLENPRYRDGISEVVLTPDARLISNAISAVSPNRNNPYGISAFSSSWGQFVGNDLSLVKGSPVNSMTLFDSMRIAMTPAAGDVESPAANESFLFRRAHWDFYTGTSFANPRRPVNWQTGWLDGSVVYGPDSVRLGVLRTFSNGLLIADSTNGAPLPAGQSCTFMQSGARSGCRQRLAGDPRANISPALLSLHGLFVLEHNWWARKFAEASPLLDDEGIFQEARKRVVAEIQAITMNEYLPTILQQQLPPYRGYNASVDPRISPLFAAAAFRFGHSGIQSTTMCIKPNLLQCPTGHLLLRESYYDSSYFTWGVTIGDIFRGLHAQLEGATDVSLVADVRNYLEGKRQDLAVFDILRGRDFGVPTFANVRRGLGMRVPTSFSDISQNLAVHQALATAYNGSVTNVDLYVGGLAETVGSGAFIGPTFSAIIKDQFLRLRDGDLYWYENTGNNVTVGSESKRYFTNEEITEISATTLSTIIARNTDWKNPPNNVFLTPGRLAVMVNTDAYLEDAAVCSIADAVNSQSAVINSHIVLTWSVPRFMENWMNFTLTFWGAGYVAMGFGSRGMTGSDLWVMRRSPGDGTCDIKDMYMARHEAPDVDARQDVQLLACSNVNRHTTYRFRRRVFTGDAMDNAIVPGPMPVVFAWNTERLELGAHGSNAVRTTIEFIPAQQSAANVSDVWFSPATATGIILVTESPVLGETLVDSHGWHAVSMLLVWAFLIPAGVISMRFCKHRANHGLFHKWAGVTAATLFIPVVGRGIASAAQSPGGRPHVYLGLIITPLFIFQIVAGAILRNWLTEASAPPWYWRYNKVAHRYSGWTLVLFSLINCTLGAGNITKNGSFLMISYTAIIVSVVSVFLVLQRYGIGCQILSTILDYGMRRTGTTGKASRRLSLGESKTSIPMAELKAQVRAGQKWVVCEGNIYDIARWIPDHPGGAYLLHRYIGLDVSQLFMGHTAYDENVSKHKHTQQAMELLQTMCVGALQTNLDWKSWADAPIVDDEQCTNVWKVVKRTIINRRSARPVLKLQLTHDLAKATAAIEWRPLSFGRHVVAKCKPGDIKKSAVRDPLMMDAPAAGGGEGKGMKKQAPKAPPRPASLPNVASEGSSPLLPSGATSPTAGSPSGSGISGSTNAGSPTADAGRAKRPSVMARSASVDSAPTAMLDGASLPAAGGSLVHVAVDVAGGGSAVYGSSVPPIKLGITTAQIPPATMRGSSAPSPRTMAHMEHNNAAEAASIAPGEESHANPYRPKTRVGDATHASSPTAGSAEGEGRGGGSLIFRESRREGKGEKEASGIRTARKAVADTAQVIFGRKSRAAGDDSHSNGGMTSRGGGAAMIERPYTIVRTHSKPGLTIYVRLIQRGQMSPYLWRLKKGDELTLAAPKGVGMHLDNAQGGVVVAVCQGTAAAVVFDLIQYIYHQPRADGQPPLRPMPIPSGSNTPLASGSSGLLGALSSFRVKPAEPGQPPQGLSRRASSIGLGKDFKATDAAGNPLPVSAALDANVPGSIKDATADHDPAPVSRQTVIPSGGAGAVPGAPIASPRVLAAMTPRTARGGAAGAAPLPGAPKDLQGSRLKLILLVAELDEDSVLELDWLRQMDALCEDFELHLQLKSLHDEETHGLPEGHVQTGRLDPTRLEELLPKSDLLTVSICGSAAFQNAVSDIYLTMGLPRSVLTVVG